MLIAPRLSVRLNPRVEPGPYVPAIRWKIVKRPDGWHAGPFLARNRAHAEEIFASYLPHGHEAAYVKGDVCTRQADGRKWKMDTTIDLPGPDSSVYVGTDGVVYVAASGRLVPAARIIGAVVK